MFNDYRSAVLARYHYLVKSGSISHNLKNPTPASIKREWILALQNISRKDEPVLHSFVGHRENNTAYERAIRRMPADRFKQVSKFLRGEAVAGDHFIELAAWLINFSPRPYNHDFDYKKLEADQPVSLLPGELIEVEGGSVGIKSGSDKEKVGLTLLQGLAGKTTIKAIALSTVVVSLTALTTNWLSGSSAASDQQCMYWGGTHYVRTDCNEQIPGVQIIGFNDSQMHYFQKITRPDTLTEDHIGKVWYRKTNNQLELFTSDGPHPDQPHRRLRPLTRYMFDKYVRTKKVKTR